MSTIIIAALMTVLLQGRGMQKASPPCDHFSAFIFRDDNSFLLASEQGNVTIRKTDGTRFATIPDLNVAGREIHQVEVVASGAKLVAATVDELIFFDCDKRRQICAYPIKSRINGFALYPNQKYAAVLCGDRTVKIIDLVEKKECASLAPAERTHAFEADGVPNPACVAVSPDGALVAVGYSQVFFKNCHSVHIWDAKNYKPLYHWKVGLHSITWSIDFHPKKIAELAVPGPFDTAELWNPRKMTSIVLHKLKPGACPPTLLRFSPNGKALLLGSFDGSLLLIEKDNERPIFKYNRATTSLSAVSYSPNSKLIGILISEGLKNPTSRLLVFEVETARCVLRLSDSA